jgi:UPF0176 protein
VTPLFHIAFYRFVALPHPAEVAELLRELTQALTGSVLVACEGINGVLAGPATALDAFEQQLQHDPRLAGAFLGMAFKRSACRTPPFGRIKVHVKPEIVALGVAGASAPPRPHNHVSPAEWRALIRQPDVVVLDNRNSFEFRLGRFKGALDPRVDRFSDFPAYVQAHAARWKAEGRRIAMYCTGGIRCEKTGGWMQHTLGLEVHQLDGGILHHFQSLPDAQADWDGECFVFDNRIALDTRLQQTDTTAETVYADDPWRLARARRLAAAV